VWFGLAADQELAGRMRLLTERFGIDQFSEQTVQRLAAHQRFDQVAFPQRLINISIAAAVQ
jgi:hypothetical protein